MNEGIKNKVAQIFYRQLVNFEKQLIKSGKEIIFLNSLEQYHRLLKSYSEKLDDYLLKEYCFDDSMYTTSAKDNKYVYFGDFSIQIVNLKIYLENTYRISSPEVSMIKDEYLQIQYEKYLLDSEKNTAHSVLLSITTEVEDRLRNYSQSLKDEYALDLVNKALHPKTGVLMLNDRNGKECEGFYNIIKRFYSYVRGKPHHHCIKMIKQDLFRNIMIVDYILNEFNNLKEKTYEPATEQSTTTKPSAD